jgi:chemotaxis protein methyltransferase CheR
MTNRAIAPNGARLAGPAAAQIARFRDLVENRCGLFFGESRQTSLQSAVGVRMQELGLDDADAYFERLRGASADDEFRKLIHLVTITETCFLRDPAQFRLLREHVIPSVLDDRRRDGSQAVRIWSAGCSSGEEPYSVALLLRDMGVHLTHPDWTFDIVGTDLNTERLEAARRGVYGTRAVRNVEGAWLQRFFEPDGDQFRLKNEIRRSVQFREGNLASDRGSGAPPGRADIILCKNVAIYFRSEVTRRLVERLYDALTEGGYLLLGHSESLWQMESRFTLVEHAGIFCYRKGPTRESTAVGWRAKLAAGVRPPPSPRLRRTAVALAEAGQPDHRVFETTSGHDRRADTATPASPDATTTAPAGQYERCLEAVRSLTPQAEAEVRELIRTSPAFVPAHLLLGGLYAQRGRYAEARTQAELVLALDDMDARAHLLLGMIDGRAGRAADAILSLRRALYLDDGLALAYFWLGNLYRDRGDADRACGEHLELVRRHRQHTLDFTEEFASDLTPAQIAHACLQTVRRLRESA